jgi:hypothetical protein
MRWGITEEMASEVCLEEVEKCHEHSIGPSFVVIFDTLLNISLIYLTLILNH